MIVAVLALGGRALPTRAGVVLEPLPRVPRPMRPATIAGLALAAAGLAALVSPTIRLGLNLSIVFAILALSLVVLVGLVGQISLGQLAIAGLAAFALARYLGGWPFPLGLLVAGFVSTAIAVLVGLPALRVRGAQLAVVTLAGAAAVQAVVFTTASTPAVAPPRLAGLDLAAQQGDTIARLPFTITLLVVLVLVAVTTSRTIGGSLGRRFLAVRNNEQAAASVGINVAATKVAALAVAGLIAGIGGGLLAYNNQAVSGSSFDVFSSIGLLVFAYIGGITGIGGALYAGILAPAGIVYVLISQHWNVASTTYGTIAAIVLILVALFNPQGVSDAVRVTLERLRLKVFRRAPERPVVLPEPPDLPVSRAALQAGPLTVRYGGVTAVEDVRIEVAPGEIAGLIGPNGAGKTSLLDALTGFSAAQGPVVLGGRELAGLKPHARCRAGLARTWQAGQLFEDLPVVDNVRVAAADDAAVAWALHLAGITGLAARRPAELSGGQRKLVSLARALASRPSVLLADEPAAGLDSFESRQLGTRLKAIAGAGVGVLLIEHDLALVLAVCDRIHVLDQGRLIASGPPEAIRTEPAVLSAYLGQETA
ncbi:ATP-binding cassette domain-containing protein [Amycolatopsis jejuensis]|uniref:ATP-binding cassette domain-containing protein n=1 Tax=Amycolatopsis jejuensis TaxID=330084 RepID=UPI00068ED6E4|nr:ATP-binding cassette domain-containing protein [Amycolatopsis jejuensis]